MKIKYLTWYSFFEYNGNVIKNSHFGGVDFIRKILKAVKTPLKTVISHIVRRTITWQFFMRRPMILYFP